MQLQQAASCWVASLGFGCSGLRHCTLLGCMFKRGVSKMSYPYSNRLWLIVTVVAVAEVRDPEIRAEDDCWQCCMEGHQLAALHLFISLALLHFVRVHL